MNQKGQVFSNTINFLVVILVVGIMIYAFSPVITTIWDLNINAPNYTIARTIIDLWPLLLVISIIAMFWMRQSQTPAQA